MKNLDGYIDDLPGTIEPGILVHHTQECLCLNLLLLLDLF